MKKHSFYILILGAVWALLVSFISGAVGDFDFAWLCIDIALIFLLASAVCMVARKIGK